MAPSGARVAPVEYLGKVLRERVFKLRAVVESKKPSSKVGFADLGGLFLNDCVVLYLGHHSTSRPCGRKKFLGKKKVNLDRCVQDSWASVGLPFKFLEIEDHQCPHQGFYYSWLQTKKICAELPLSCPLGMR